MKKSLTIFVLILALLLTTGCAASNTSQNDSGGVMAAAESNTDAAASGSPIGEEEAQAIALDHAGITATAVTALKTEFDREDNAYEVDFNHGDYEYDYEIHALSGQILAHDKDYEPAPVKTTEQPTEKETERHTEKETEKPTEKATEKPTEAAKTLIGKDKAKAIALDHAGVSSSKATKMKVELDDGKYEVEFRYNNYEYDYEINAYSGKVLSHDKEYDAPPETKPASTTKAKKNLIGKDKAKAIALDHAGVSAGDVREFEVEYDKDDGVPVYEVSFECGKLEYSYEIHAETGKILSREVDD